MKEFLETGFRLIADPASHKLWRDRQLKALYLEREVPMLDEIRKGLLSGLGAVFLTKDKIERITRKMVEEAKMSKEDAQNLREDLYKTGEKEWSELEEFFSGIIRKIMQGLDLSTKSELNELKSRVAELEKRLAVQEMKSSIESTREESEI